MSMPNFGNQAFCKYRQPQQQSAAATYVIDVSKAFLGALLGSLIAIGIWSEIAEYRMKAKMKDAVEDMQRQMQNIKLPVVPKMPQ